MSGGGLLRSLGLDRPELRAWAMYDWANSAFVTTIVTAVYPIYFARVAGRDFTLAEAQERFFLATAIAMTVSAVLSPWLGALADASGRSKRMLGGSLAVALAATVGLFFVHSGDWLLGAVLFGIGNIGASASFVFYDALLPHVAREDEMDRVSTAGYALGYVGGGVLLVLNLAWITKPSLFGLPSGEGLSESAATLPTRLAFLSVAVWWLAFSVPLFRKVSDPPPRVVSPGGRHPFATAAVAQLARTYRALRRYPQALLMLIAFLLFNDGIGTVFRAGASYADAIHVPQEDVMIAIVLVQFAGIPFAFAFGALAGRFGVKRSILAALAVYVAIVVFAVFIRTTAQFYAMAIAVSTVQGGAQALSRSLFASLVPRERTGEFFGFFSVVEKFAGVAGPALFALTLHVTRSWFPEGSTRPIRCGVLSILPFFVLGMVLLAKVDVVRGRSDATRGSGTST